ncbi:hypothetical protein [Pseudoalteromonas sp. Of11M-6]|uniref:hypothetical protein n=1 Tax=Pseudoalteromonas sp. Of11M-6 TaxID=2917754 RepID=UPI001EF73059|nr:hypothetical protein [Pseudoalteromonas sp. Of11M-6]MCG7556249.1 hypothetical protein [Pseudoalteromonas sp. Of11M-6]
MKRFLTLIFLFTLSGCASNAKYGNFTNDSATQSAVNAELALDVAIKINELYAPAHTKLSVAHEINDNFGSTLIKVLREQGFALSEYTKNSSSDGVKLFYVVDHLDENNLVVSVHLNSTSLSRAYTVQQNKASAIGFWSVKE